MIGHRDGIVGSWRTPQNATLNYDLQRFLPLDDYRQLWRWEPWVRATAIDFELLSNVRFSIVTDAAANVQRAQLWHRPSGGGNDLKIVNLSRPSELVFQAQAEWLDFYSDLRDDRMAEILCQMGPQHAFWGMLIYLHPSRTPRTIELLDMAVRFAIFTEIRFKHAIAAPRAIEYSSQVQPMIQTPGHGSMPSGHSTQAFIVAVVLCALFNQQFGTVFYQQAMRQAYRVAVNRTVAGVHFPVDSIAGHVLGTALGEYLVARCTALLPPAPRAPLSPPNVQHNPAMYTRLQGKVTPRSFKGEAVTVADNPDFDYHEPLSPNDVANYAQLHGINANTVPGLFPFLGWDPAVVVDGSEILSWLWNQAESEWNGNSLANTQF